MELIILLISFDSVLETELHQVLTVPKYCSFTFDVIICSTEVSKIHAVSGKVQLCPLYSTQIMCGISTLSNFPALTMPRYHLSIYLSN